MKKTNIYIRTISLAVVIAFSITTTCYGYSWNSLRPMASVSFAKTQGIQGHADYATEKGKDETSVDCIPTFRSYKKFIITLASIFTAVNVMKFIPGYERLPKLVITILLMKIALPLIVLYYVSFPILNLIHEIGHYYAYKRLGFHPKIVRCETRGILITKVLEEEYADKFEKLPLASKLSVNFAGIIADVVFISFFVIWAFLDPLNTSTFLFLIPQFRFCVFVSAAFVAGPQLLFQIPPLGLMIFGEKSDLHKAWDNIQAHRRSTAKHGKKKSSSPKPELHSIRESEADIPIYSCDPEKGMYPYFNQQAAGLYRRRDPERIKGILTDVLTKILSQASREGFTVRPVDILIMGSANEAENDIKAVFSLFPKVRRLCFVDIAMGNLKHIQELARELPDEQRSKIELYHADFSDMNILSSDSFDIVIASKVFTTTLWDSFNDFKRYLTGKPVVTDEEIENIFLSWSKEVARLLKREPSGILITTFGYEARMEGFGFYRNRDSDERYSCVWSKDRWAFNINELLVPEPVERFNLPVNEIYCAA